MRLTAPLFGLGLHSKSPNVTANKLINAYFEFSQERDYTSVAIYGTPGLTLFADNGDTPWRGLHAFPGNSLMYGVHRGTFYEINNAGVIVSRGTIGTTTGRVDISDDGTYIAIVDGSEIYTYNTSTTTFAAVSDGDRPTSPNTCTFQGGRIITDEDATGQFKGGDAYDPTSWEALNFATAESNPDDLIRVINYRGVLALFGDYSTEFWQLVGGAGFPYAKIQSADVEYGLAARWSVARMAGTYAFLAKNREGEVFLAALSGYNAPQRLSNHEFENEINNYSNVADATGFGYMLDGHPMYQINFPSEGKSWLYDASTKYLSELRFGANARHRAEIGIDFLNQFIVADYSDGKLYKIDNTVYTDNGNAIHTILRGRHIFKDKKKMRIDRIEVGIEAGVGLATGQGSDPVMGLRLSKDGGHTFGTQIFATMGKIGEYLSRAIFRSLGSGRDIVPEITVTDPVKRVFTEATLVFTEGLS